MFSLMTRLISPGGRRGTLSVLLFHRVFAEVDPLAAGEPTVEVFERLLTWVKSQFAVLPLRDAVRRLANGDLPPAAAAITFDDGYRDNLELAAPVLRRQNVPATFFVASGFLDGGIMFNDVVIESIRQWRGDRIDLAGFGLGKMPTVTAIERSALISCLLKVVKHMPLEARDAAVQRLAMQCRAKLPRDLMMTTAQLQALAAQGFDVGGHTDRHPILCKVDNARAQSEMQRGRARLQTLLDREIALFAYPNGRWREDYDRRHRDLAQRCGFEAAFNTEAGVCTPEADRWNLPRFTPWDRGAIKFGARLLVNQARRPVFDDGVATVSVHNNHLGA